MSDFDTLLLATYGCGRKAVRVDYQIVFMPPYPFVGFQIEPELTQLHLKALPNCGLMFILPEANESPYLVQVG